MARRQTESRIDLSRDMRRMIFQTSGKICAHCGCELDFDKNFSVEHVIPLRKGGNSRPKNLVALCRDCNQTKSDDVIQPASYYKYLPKTRINELEELFDEYLETTDWLAYDNLFRTDRETMIVTIEHQLANGNRLPIPAKIDIQKIPAEEAFEYLQFYTARLKPEDKHIMASSVDELRSPYYRITNGTTTLMICTAYASPINYNCEEKGVNTTLHGVRIDFFTNPELRNKPILTPRLLYAGLCTVMARIQDTLMRGYEQKSLIQCLIQYPASDTYGDAIFAYTEHCFPGRFAASLMYDGDDVMQPIHSQTAWFYQGRHVGSISKVDPRLDGTPEEVTAALLELQNPFKERLSESKQLRAERDAPDKKKPKKRDNPKQSHYPSKKRAKHAGNAKRKH